MTDGECLITWILPIKTVSEANISEHWSKRAKRRKQQGYLVRYMFKKEKVKIELPCHITLTRLAPRMLDTDNLPTSMKAIQDEIADILVPEKGGWYKTKKGRLKRKKGHSDSDSRLSWGYEQEKCETQSVRVSVSFSGIGEIDKLVLSDRDRDLFLEALKNPPQPNEKFKKSFNLYKQHSNSNSDIAKNNNLDQNMASKIQDSGQDGASTTTDTV